MITIIKTSLFDSPAKAIVNTVNTVGVMGKGIAKQFKKLYPDMYGEYREYCNSGRFKTGMLHIYRTPNKIIINFPTKAHWRGKSRVEFVEQGLKKFVEHYAAIGINSVSFPQLGCGNGELDWEIEVKPLMLEHLSNLSIPVYIHMYRTPKGFIPERIDKEYKKAVLIERERNSADSVWNDLIMLVSGDNG
ncbi:MAG: macro domain-containing protein, partial [Candidatus Marinimicrobia bacterium]|nr:macro domain-containing protein [Candidatus Neomarinimicrobiota bacterium]